MSELQLRMKNGSDIIQFPRLRELRGKHRITYKRMAEVMGAKSHQTAYRKINDGSFTFFDMYAILDFFNSLGESETIDSLFFTWITQMRN